MKAAEAEEGEEEWQLPRPSLDPHRRTRLGFEMVERVEGGKRRDQRHQHHRRRWLRYQFSLGKTEITTEYYWPLWLLNQIFQEWSNTVVDTRTTANDGDDYDKKNDADDANHSAEEERRKVVRP